MTSPLEGIRDALADITRQEFSVLNVPPGPHSYRVAVVRDDGRCDLRAVKAGPPPEIPNVDHWAGSGAASKPQAGSLVVVSFLDGDPNAPMIGSYQPLRMAGGKPTESTLDATVLRLGPTADLVQLAVGPMSIAKAVGRVDDAVEIGYMSAALAGSVVTLTFSKTVLPAPAVHLTGKISEGSLKVTAG